MLIKQLHTIVNDALYAIEWDGEGLDCMELFNDRMTDAEFLKTYFTQNENKLKYYQQTKIIREAVIETTEEIDFINEELTRLAKSGKQYRSGEHLSTLFVPLDNRKGVIEFGPAKAKGHPHFTPWIRLYAIKLDTNEYVITGGGIKLVKRMEDDPELAIELKKLKVAESYFSDED